MKGSRLGMKIWVGWTWLTDGLLCLLLTAMIALACTHITLRTFFSGGFLWADPLLRYMVLWSGMLGAVVATREGKHIAIDVITYLAPQKIKAWIQLVINLFSTAVAVMLTRASVVFVFNEARFGAAGLLGIPSWVWNLIFPGAFALIAIHFLIALFIDILALFGVRFNQSTRGEKGTGNE